MRPGHAEIVGGGLAGLTAGLALAKSGWRVRVHERSAELREIGAGLYLKENSLRVLERLGVFDEVAAHGVRLERMDIHDVDRDRWLIREVSQLRVYNVVRTALHRTLAQAAVARGAELLTGSTGVHAEPSGRLRLASGESVTADLVVGADGIYSKIRESVRLGRALRILPEGGTRLLVKRTEAEFEGLECRTLVGQAPDANHPMQCYRHVCRAYGSRVRTSAHQRCRSTSDAGRTLFPVSAT